MAIDPMHSLQLATGPPLEVAHLGVVVPDEDLTDRAQDELDALRLRLETERRAGHALLAAVAELERRLGAERATSQALLTTVRDLDGALEAERTQARAQRESNCRLWSQVSDLSGALALAERPLWRKLLRRA